MCQIDEDALADQARNNDGEALATLALRYWKPIYRLASNMLSSSLEAAEVTEDAFLLALSSLEPFGLSFYRAAIRLSRIRAGLEPADGLDRAAFLLPDVEQLPVEKTAAILHQTPRTIRARAHRVRLKLTGFLRDLFSSRARTRPAHESGG